MRSTKSWRYLLAGLFTLGLLLGAAREARAQSGFWRPQGQKAGPFMFNLKMGGAFGAYYYNYYRGFDLFALQTEFGVAVTPDRNGYLIFPLQFQFAPGLAVVMLPVGFQYDIGIPLEASRKHMLYLTPRASAGFAVWSYYNYYGPVYGPYFRGAVDYTGFFLPEFGAKYVFRGRLNLGFDPFSLPIFFGPNGAAIQYRVSIYAGLNF